jgi:hypothetical protein
MATSKCQGHINEAKAASRTALATAACSKLEAACNSSKQTAAYNSSKQRQHTTAACNSSLQKTFKLLLLQLIRPAAARAQDSTATGA